MREEVKKLKPLLACVILAVGLAATSTGLRTPNISSVEETAQSSAETSRDRPLFVAPGVAYQPRKFVPGSNAYASQEQIIADLRLLRSAGFRSLVTYGAGSGLGSVPELARK